MDEIQYPIKEITRLTHVGRSFYIRIPYALVQSGKFPITGMMPLVIKIESKERIVITPLKL